MHETPTWTAGRNKNPVQQKSSPYSNPAVQNKAIMIVTRPSEVVQCLKKDSNIDVKYKAALLAF